MKQNNQSTSPKDYFRKSASSFLKSFVYLAFGFYNLAKRGYNKLTKKRCIGYLFCVCGVFTYWVANYLC